jgi:hypothetical protein
MATCKQCGAETELYSNGVPVCLACTAASAAKSESTTNDVQLSLPH